MGSPDEQDPSDGGQPLQAREYDRSQQNDAARAADQQEDLSDVIDLDEAARRIPGGPDFVVQMARLLLDECPKLTGRIRDAIAQGDAAALQLSAHTLKSSADTFGAKCVRELALRLETMARERKLDDAASTQSKLETEVERLLAVVSRM